MNTTSRGMRHAEGFISYVAGVARSLSRHEAFRASNAIAFDAFLSLIPLLAMAGWALHTLHHGSDIFASLIQSAPGPVASLVDGQFLRLSDEGIAALAPISAVGFLWVSSAGLSTAMGVFETMFFAKPRLWYLRRALAVVCVILAIVVTALIAASMFFIAQFLGASLAGVIAGTIPMLLLLSGLTGFFRVAVARPKGMRRRLLPGAVVTLGLWIMTTIVFSFYVARFARYATFYGNLATVAILLFWLWLLSLALLVGGEINARLEGVRDPSWTTKNNRRQPQ